jgi:hypothetical protein
MHHVMCAEKMMLHKKRVFGKKTLPRPWFRFILNSTPTLSSWCENSLVHSSARLQAQNGFAHMKMPLVRQQYQVDVTGLDSPRTSICNHFHQSISMRFAYRKPRCFIHQLWLKMGCYPANVESQAWEKHTIADHWRYPRKFSLQYYMIHHP